MLKFLKLDPQKFGPQNLVFGNVSFMMIFSINEKQCMLEESPLKGKNSTGQHCIDISADVT